ncbi:MULTISPECIES: GTP pyrophosphokinase family protein [unclassified Fusibacter]|uniref:GTP pyrophosphokinase n=1 Tax=unclassified Fusibacter TaxID=2624464 RepID=UPI0010128F18|nr:MULTISPECIES: GTP pyrophosphokinase family protein [unclassified Fusibacter]MCK8058623.1 GTP pyrophosphokinase family protein [Fusibacter sp. A2]NPE21698.1 GTP pyrophosphokinase family protein [Fusibacter sp. A1]RXV61273.1 GTP pyrophosphokinase family protein [Fusibacter sp. A1]
MYDTLMTDDMKPWRDLLLVHKFAVEEIRTKLNILDEEFRNIHDYNPIEHIRHRVKKTRSIMEKLVRLGHAPTVENAKEHIFDIAGIRIICAFSADIYRVVDLLESQSDIKIVAIKDYIQNPKSNGYRSLHVHIEYPVFLSSGTVPTRVEIQLRTIGMDFWASIEHKIYYKYREKAPISIQGQLQECADLIAQLDDRMLYLKQEIQDLDQNPAVKPSTSNFIRDKDNY